MNVRARRWGIATMSALAVMTLAAGCSGQPASDGEESSSEPAKKGAVAMGFAGLDIDIWNDILALMKPEIEAAGYELLSSDPQWDVQKQVSDWEAWIQRGDVKAIMGFPVQSDAMVPVTAKAVSEGIPVLAYGTTWKGAQEGTMFDPYEDGYTVGTAAAEWIAENASGASEVPIALVADKTSDLGNGRVQGIQDALAELAPTAKVYELPGISREDGNSVAKSHLVAVPETKVWIGNNNDNALGVYQSLLDSGIAKDDASVWLGAPDATNETLDVISVPGSIWRGGFILPAKPVAESNVKLLLQAAAGEQVEGFTIPLIPVTAQNASEFYVE